MKAIRKVRERLAHHEHVRTEDARDASPIRDHEHPLAATDPAVFHAREEPTNVEVLMSKTETVRSAIAHPRQTIKQHSQKTFVDQFVLTEQPWLADQHKANQQYREAHDKLLVAKAKLGEQPKNVDIAAEVDAAETQLLLLEQRREELEVAWHMSRYVHRARIVRADMSRPSSKDMKYRTTGASGSGKEQFLWVKWVGHLLIYGFQDAAAVYIDPTNELPYNRQELIRSIERLLVTSQGFQAWWNRVRYVYRWEDPWLTTKWFLLFLVLLKTGYFMTFYYSYLLHSYLSNWSGKHTREWMFESNERASKTHGRAVMLSELILRHGADAWFEPVMEEIGPWLQEQILDLAQFLAISNSYYMWRNRRAGIYTCIGYIALGLTCALPSLEWSIKVFWLSCGLYFFMARPISSVYPRFRHAVDPIRWLYWGHPTQSEYCFAWLRGNWQLILSHTTNINHEHEDDSELDSEISFFDCIEHATEFPQPLEANIDAEPAVMSWPAHCAKRRGRIELTNNAIRFVSHGGIDGATHWSHPFAELLELQKLTLPLTSLPNGPSLTKMSKSSAALSIVFVRPETQSCVSTTEEQPNDERVREEVIYAMHESACDEVFNTIIGFSGATWQELQSEAKSKEGRTFFR